MRETLAGEIAACERRTVILSRCIPSTNGIDLTARPRPRSKALLNVCTVVVARRASLMPSVARIHRLLQIIDLLQSGRSYNTVELAEICGVSRRTIFRDLQTLADSGLPVRYDEPQRGYTMPTTSVLPPTDLTLQETLSLLILCHELGREKTGIPFQKAARTAAAKLASSLPRNLRDYAAELTQGVQVRLDAHNPLPQSASVYELLQDSLARRRKVRIAYHSLAEQKEITTLLSPYRLLFSRRSWYVIGRSSVHRDVRTFNVGRILSAEATDQTFRIPARFSLSRYLGNAWHLIRERGKSAEVVLRFQPLVAQNVAEVQWHRTQRVAFQDDGSLEFRVTVDGLGEILWWILGYGDQVEVLEPPELRRMVADRVRAMSRIYNGEAKHLAERAAPARRQRSRRSAVSASRGTRKRPASRRKRT